MRDLLWGVKRPAKYGTYDVIPIVSANQKLSEKVASLVTMYLAQEGQKAAFLDREYSMLSKAIRVIKTQKKITVYKMAIACLELARENQNHSEACARYDTDTTFIQSYSTIYTIMHILLMEYAVKRRFLKQAIRKGLTAPEFMFILQVDPKQMFENRKKFDHKHKVEDSQKGASFLNRDNKDARIAAHLQSVGIPTFRVDARTATPEQVATAIVNIIKQEREKKNAQSTEPAPEQG